MNNIFVYFQNCLFSDYSFDCIKEVTKNSPYNNSKLIFLLKKDSLDFTNKEQLLINILKTTYIQEYEIIEVDNLDEIINTIYHFNKDKCLFLCSLDDSLRDFIRQTYKFNLNVNEALFYDNSFVSFEIIIENKIITNNLQSINVKKPECLSNNGFESVYFDINNEILRYIGTNNLFYIRKISEMLPEKRFKHSLSVAKLSYKIAEVNYLKYNINPRLAYFSGLFHDLGKYLDEYEEKTIIDQFFGCYKDLPKYAFHQFSALYLVRKLFNLYNKDLDNAIAFHCTGNKEMSDLAKIIYAADKIDPLRGYDSTELIKAMYCDIEDGFKTVLQANLDFLISVGDNPMSNVLTNKCVNYYLDNKQISLLNKKIQKGID